MIDVHISSKNSPPAMPAFPDETKEYKSAKSLIGWIVGFIFIFQAKYHIPNSAVNLLLKFLCALFYIFSCFWTMGGYLHKLFPQSLYVMRQQYLKDCTFSKYPVCPKCSKIFPSYDDCIEIVGSKRLSKRCNFVAFPNHPHSSRRVSCQGLLLKRVQFSSGHEFLYPFKVYCYSGIRSTLEKLLLRPNFVALCNLWREKDTVSNVLQDIYDGRVWKEFSSSFLTSPFSLGLILNLDFFQPYEHTVYSVGVLYLTVLNLPRTIRYKLENIIIVGIIPGPREPSTNGMNFFLEPLVHELQQFWSGVKMHVNMSSENIERTVRCALLCVSCDLPAGRKACGFLSYNARLGCTKCLKEFPGTIGSQDFSGFDRSKWTARSDDKHRENITKLKQCTYRSSLTKLESELGCRVSVLLDLPYFSPTRFLIIDPMHNLFLGTGKRVLSLWINSGLLSSTHFVKIQDLVDSMVVPPDVGRIPLKISSGFSGFKADQFKTWINVFSIPALYDVLPTDHFECWRHFVLACRILCRQALTEVDITLADTLLLQFCNRVQRLYGASAITPNMHLHGHLRDVILDYGPIQEYWCFSFERYNGILGKQPTNNRAIEPQLLQQFLIDNYSSSYEFPIENFKKTLHPYH